MVINLNIQVLLLEKVANVDVDIVTRVVYLGNRQISVSYTHLDVYKRQGEGIILYICTTLSAAKK